MRVVRPSFAWSGDALQDVPEVLKRDIEAICTNALATASAASGLVEPTEQHDLPPPLSNPPVESLDSTRFEQLLSVYTVPSYQGGNHTVPVGRTITFTEAEADAVIHWQPIDDSESLDAALTFELLLRGESRPSSGYLGTIHQTSSREMVVSVKHYPENNFVISHGISGLKGPRVNARGTALTDEPMPLPEEGHYRLRWRADGAAANRAQVIEDFYEDRLTRLFREHGRRPHTMRQEEFEDQVKHRVADSIAALVARVPRTPPVSRTDRGWTHRAALDATHPR